jgi:tubulin-specific chaperone A
MAPSQLQITISSLQRMLKEEASYYKEQEQQAVRIAKLEKETGEEDEPGNREFQLKQEVRLPTATRPSGMIQPELTTGRL